MVLNGSTQLPNPHTPLAFLPPDVAFQFTIATYSLVAGLVALIWDILGHLLEDYKLLSRSRIGAPTCVYFSSRIFSLVYQLLTVILATAPVGAQNCRGMTKATLAFLPLAIPATSLLFLFHVYAMYMRNKWVVAFFGIMWLGVVASCLTPAFSATYWVGLGPTAYCVFTRIPKYGGFAAIVTTVNDWLMFIALVWRVLQNSYAESRSMRNGLHSMLYGRHLPALSKALLHNGQAYFMATAGINLFSVVIYYIDPIPIAYRATSGVLNVTLMNTMACRLFRNTKLGKFDTVSMSSTLMMGRSRDSHRLAGTSTQGILEPIVFQRDARLCDSEFEEQEGGLILDRSLKAGVR